MNILKRASILLFCCILLIPLFTFNFERDAVSPIDNRKRAAFPQGAAFFPDGAFQKAFARYVSDRAGLRDRLILWRTVLNDRLFGKMLHPGYRYGQKGYVFGAGLTTPAPSPAYLEDFAAFVSRLHAYCKERNVPFVFAFSPAKPAVLREFIPATIRYDRRWVDDFFRRLDEYGVPYTDNTAVLRARFEAGEAVFNRQYDANHWNDTGAFYGVNAILRALQEQSAAVSLNRAEDFSQAAEIKTSLPVSQFPIREQIPVWTPRHPPTESKTDLYAAELTRSEAYAAFGYQINAHVSAAAPRALVFQGSYMNGMDAASQPGYGQKFLANAFREYIFVHDYQNVINFDYYFHIFRPDCVIFEAAEYTFSNAYFDQEAMRSKAFSPPLSHMKAQSHPVTIQPLAAMQAGITQGKALTTISVQSTARCAYLMLDGEKDMQPTPDGFQITLPTELWLAHGGDAAVALIP